MKLYAIRFVSETLVAAENIQEAISAFEFNKEEIVRDFEPENVLYVDDFRIVTTPEELPKGWAMTASPYVRAGYPESDLFRVSEIIGENVQPKYCPFCDSSNVSVVEDNTQYAKYFAAQCNTCGAKGSLKASRNDAALSWNAVGE